MLTNGPAGIVTSFLVSYKSASAGNGSARRSSSSQDNATETSVSDLLDDLEAILEGHGAVRLLPQGHFHGGHVGVLRQACLLEWRYQKVEVAEQLQQVAENWEEGRSGIKGIKGINSTDKKTTPNGPQEMSSIVELQTVYRSIQVSQRG
jgi:hypothetical protein